ncbi:DDE-type integrase/transposase/recombinase [Pigmentibacter sp. JX0631]|uniref:Mu transposase C-terminal domain-containing protein n=1 Tax=Pigmentibacter sp. JX0631 TaxID=2976982 RepID=UPI0024697CFF|nr:Mu transposase C-terminal domain-containing protein [Pigmentibacter sp. JX0631]WGL59426.1 DDE-type integrase/transposase/recombinase [Pigmentibacter sp. JX0631]
MEKQDVTEENENSGTSSLAIGPVRLSEPAWEEARCRARIIQSLLKIPKISEKKRQAAANELGISKRTLSRLIKRYKASGNLLSALAPQPPSGGLGKPRINENVESIIHKVVRELYLDKQKRKISKIVQEIRRRCIEANITPPGQNTVRRRISQLSLEKVFEKRSGKLSAHPFTANHGPAVTAQYPLEMFMIDHTKVDVIVVDEQQRLPIGRPCLTLAIDVFSRCIAGFYLSFEDPSAVSVGLCLTNSVFDKTDVLKKYNIQHSWPLKGKPEKIVVDQGSEFKSEALRKGCEQHGISIHWRKIGYPHLNGVIERVIGTFMKEIHEIPGTTFSNISERGNYDSTKMAVLTMPELEKWLTHAIVGKYHLEIHSSLMETPLSLFHRGIETRKKEINLVKNQKAFLIDFLPIERRTLQRHGFVIDHIFYFSNALIPWISSGKINEKFMIRRDPRNLSRIFVLHPKEFQYLEIPYRNIARPVITLWEHRESLRRLKERGLRHFDEALIFRTLLEMKEIIKNAKKETQSERKKRVKNENAKKNTLDIKSNNSYYNSNKKEQEEFDIHSIKPFEDIEDWS